MSNDTAILTVDMHHGHLTPEIATLPVPPELADEITTQAEKLLNKARDTGHQVIHVTTAYRDGTEILSNPKWGNTNDNDEDSREDISNHNIIGSKGPEILPELKNEDEDIFLQPKKRYSPFQGTDLEFILETNDISRLIIAGVNTNTCVQCTCFEATNRDYEVIVVEECVGSMDGEKFHEFGLMNIDQALGNVIQLPEAIEVLTESNNSGPN